MELKYLTAVPHHFISPSTNSPIIKPSQDNLLGLFKITGENVLLTQIEAQHLLSGTQSFNGILPEPKIKDGKYIRWTGKQIYSVILPKISLKARPKEDKLPEVIIENGELIQGQIDKGVSGKLIHIIHSDFGNVETERYMNDLQCIISRYLIKTGFSVGVSDLVVHPDIVANNKKTIKESLKAEIDLSKKVHLDILENVTNNLSEIYEGKVAKINEKLDKTVTDNTTDKLSIDNNRIAFMVTSGAKGKNLNIKQMMCLLGQQTIDGGRVPIGFTDRTLPHYPRYENGVESRGFVSSNYLEGLNPMEFFFAAMAGREGLIDTAVKTANSGYLQRCFVKAMEDLKSAHDYTIRDNNNQIIEFMYGGDGFDPVKIEKQKTNFKLITGDKLFKDYLFVENEKMDDYMLKKTITTMNKKYEKGWFKELNEYNKKVQKCLDLIHTSLVKYASSIDDVDLYYPVNINKLVKRTINIYQLDKISVKSSLDPVNVYHQIENLIENCKVNNRRNPVLEILVYDYLSPKKVLRDYKMNQEALDYIFAQIKLGFQKALVSSGEMVGPIAAQSLGQESTQLTLNSVDWDTDIMYSKNNKVEVGKIGKLIDDILNKKSNTKNIKHIPENRTQYLDISKLNIKIPSVYSDNFDDELEGKIFWKPITAITKHLPVGDLIKIKTKLGREVIATQQKSFLIWDENKKHILPIDGKELKVGDCIPVTMNLSNDKIINNIKLDKYLSKKEYLYGTDYNKCGELYDADTRTRKIGFFKKHQNKSFTIPYSRLDSFIDTWKGKKLVKTTIEKGYIYPKKVCKTVSKIPENIVLDEEFGFIVGIYLSEGWSTNTFVGVSNNDENIRNKITNWCDKLNITYHLVITNSKRFENSKSSDLKIHSVVLARFFKKWLGTGSKNKIIPVEAFNSNLKFVKGLIDGYISGDGTINKKDGSVIASSSSKEMIIGLSNLLSRFGIFAKLSGHQPKSNNVNSKCINYCNTIAIRNYNAIKFAETFKLTQKDKQLRLNTITLKKQYTRDLGYTKFKDCVMDEIISIDFVKPSNEYVYDFTVPDTLNFAIFNGIQMRDTFHLAGVGSSSKITQGVPRLRELIKVTKNPKNPSNYIYLKDNIRFHKEKVEKVKNSIEQTKIGEILKSDPAFYLEPTNKLENVLEEDREFMKFYEVFSELDKSFQDIPKNPWVVRMEFDRKEMIYRNISMADVHQALKVIYPGANMMYSDDNAGKLVFRLRIPFESKDVVNKDIKYLEGKAEEIKEIIIKGVDNIEKVYISEPTKDCLVKGEKCKGFTKVGEFYEAKEEFHLSTDGANLFDLLMREDVDSYRSYTSNPHEMMGIFGIEAGKFIIEQQIRSTMASNNALTSPRHIGLLVNKMSHNREFMSVDRHGINREDIGPLAKASFEQTSEQFKEAALFGAVDKLEGVSANIIVGQIPKSGTGAVKLYLDEDLLASELKKRGTAEKEIKAEEVFNIDTIMDNKDTNFCVSDDDRIKVNLNTIEKDGLSLSHIPEVVLE